MSEQTQAAAPAAQTDYTKLKGDGLVAELGADATKWATAAGQFASIITGGHMTHGFLRDWFGKALSVGKVAVDEGVSLVDEARQFNEVLIDKEKALIELQQDLDARAADLETRAKALEAAEAGFAAKATGGEGQSDQNPPAPPPQSGEGGDIHPPGNPEE